MKKWVYLSRFQGSFLYGVSWKYNSCSVGNIKIFGGRASKIPKFGFSEVDLKQNLTSAFPTNLKIKISFQK